jgi:catechol 2,3-dioxygenase-like lactoylglutathione lyase family enzyme
MRLMQITASAISLNVDDPAASAEFAKRHFGFEEEMAADGFASLAHPNAGFNLIFLRVGLPTFKPPAVAGRRVHPAAQRSSSDYDADPDGGVGRALLPGHRRLRCRLSARHVDSPASSGGCVVSDEHLPRSDTDENRRNASGA